jgi:hypothetical protein
MLGKAYAQANLHKGMIRSALVAQRERSYRLEIALVMKNANRFVIGFWEHRSDRLEFQKCDLRRVSVVIACQLLW